jgi:hypothetical protein
MANPPTYHKGKYGCHAWAQDMWKCAEQYPDDDGEVETDLGTTAVDLLIPFALAYRYWICPV